MYKINLSIARCIEGMIIAEPIIDLNTGRVIINEGYRLTTSMLNQLKKFNLSSIDVYIEKINNCWEVTPEITKKYKKYIYKLKAVLDELKVTQLLNIDALKDIVIDLKADFNTPSTILACINLIGLVDEYTYNHSMNVALLSMLIGKWMNYPDREVETAILMGLLHDIGEDNISTSALKHPTSLTEEAQQTKQHVLYGYQILEEIKVLQMNMVAKDSISLDKLSKLLAIADIYDTMTSNYLTHKMQSPFDVIEYMQNGLLGSLDPEILLTFTMNIANYYIGIYVLLDTNELGEVVFIHPHCVYRPIVRVNEKYIDLHIESQIKILQIA